MDEKKCEKKKVQKEVYVGNKVDCVEDETLGESCNVEMITETQTIETDECDDSWPEYAKGKKKE